MRVLSIMVVFVLVQPLNAQQSDPKELTRLVMQDLAKVRSQSQPKMVARAELTKTEPDVLSRKNDLYQSQQPPRVDDDLITTLKKIDQRLADMEARQHDYEVRLTALEKNAISSRALRAPAVLTDPLAAAAAGRRVGGYDQFGRFVGFSETAVTLPVPVAPVTTFAAPVVPVRQFAPAMVTAGFSYAASAGGCSGGSCGGGRVGLVGRLFGRRR